MRTLIIAMFCLILLSTCKKKTTIRVRLFNPALNEYVPNATIVLNEIKDGGLFSSGSCKEIASAVTDNDGYAVFDSEKLSTNSKYKYRCGIKESWGVAHANPCGSQVQEFLNKGGTQDFMLTDYIEAEFRLQVNNALNPSLAGDSLICGLEQSYYCDPVYNLCQGGGGIGGALFTHDLNYPMLSTYIGPISAKFFANRLVVKVRKRKMGVVSETIDTVRMHPYNGAITTVEINW